MDYFSTKDFEVQDGVGPGTEIFVSKLLRNLSKCTEEPGQVVFSKESFSHYRLRTLPAIMAR